jgi:hypothetical protein
VRPCLTPRGVDSGIVILQQISLLSSTRKTKTHLPPLPEKCGAAQMGLARNISHQNLRTGL